MWLCHRDWRKLTARVSLPLTLVGAFRSFLRQWCGGFAYVFNKQGVLTAMQLPQNPTQSHNHLQLHCTVFGALKCYMSLSEPPCLWISSGGTIRPKPMICTGVGVVYMCRMWCTHACPLAKIYNAAIRISVHMYVHMSVVCHTSNSYNTNCNTNSFTLWRCTY